MHVYTLTLLDRERVVPRRTRRIEVAAGQDFDRLPLPNIRFHNESLTYRSAAHAGGVLPAADLVQVLLSEQPDLRPAGAGPVPVQPGIADARRTIEVRLLLETLAGGA